MAAWWVLRTVAAVPVPSLPLRQGDSAATAASRVKRNVHQRKLVVARASTFPAHYTPVFIDESPGKRRRAPTPIAWSDGELQAANASIHCGK